MASKGELPELSFASAADLEAWLETNHLTHDGIWLKLAKKGTGVPSVTLIEAIDLGLCFGWIDSQTRGIDDVHYAVRYTPRRRRSVWSRRNVENVERLTAAGRMRPAGLEQVERAQSDGRWAAAYGGAASATVPDDLKAAFEAEPQLAKFFASLSSVNRYAILFRLQTAVRPATRARRLQAALTMLREGRTPQA